MIHYSDKNSKKRKFEQIYSAYSGRIYNFVLRISHGNEYLAEEITQTTFLKLWEKRNELVDETATQSYIYSIARNLFLNYCEHETIEYVYYNYIMRCTTDLDCSTETQLTRDFLNDFLMKIIDEMPPQRRKIFIMSKLEGKSAKEIAEEIQISSNTVERHMTLALRHVKERMLKYYNMLAPALIVTTALLS
ncbi:MAG: RNA polymerase sigma-70 factor [Muribaculaceae bacterium]|nr:RNA polymerase sigma-70 factor [Muribaculaceae bacterium]